MFHTKCPKCIAYIQDTLNHPLRLDHPLRDQIYLSRLEALLPQLAESMETFIKSYVGHKNLAPRLIRDTLNIKKSVEPDDYLRIYTLILRWYQDLYFSLKVGEKIKRKHPFQMDMETLAILATEVGAIRTSKRECPMTVFTKWFMEHYIFFLNNLDSLHDEHSNKQLKIVKSSSILETKWDRSDLNSLYD